MSAAVGAALNKVLVAILTEPKVLKNILFAILVVVVAMILPTVFVVSIFSGDFEVDTASLQQYVEDNLSAADIVLLTNVENTMEAIEEAMKLDGIYYVKAWLNEGELTVGDDIMYVLIGGDIRPHVVDALQFLVGKLKNECVEETEIYEAD